MSFLNNYRKDYYWEDRKHIISSDNEVKLTVERGYVYDSETGVFIGTMPDDWTIIDDQNGDIYEVYPY